MTRTSKRGASAAASAASLRPKHQRHRDAVTALAARLTAFVQSHANDEHVHLRPTEPYRRRVEQQLYPPTDPAS